MDSISIGMTRAGWEARMAEVAEQLESAAPGGFDFTFYGTDNDSGDQVAIVFNDDDMVAGQNGRTDAECYLEVT